MSDQEEDSFFDVLSEPEVPALPGSVIQVTVDIQAETVPLRASE